MRRRWAEAAPLAWCGRPASSSTPSGQEGQVATGADFWARLAAVLRGRDAVSSSRLEAERRRRRQPASSGATATCSKTGCHAVAGPRCYAVTGPQAWPSRPSPSRSPPASPFDDAGL
jgi:hypothetical protein